MEPYPGWGPATCPVPEADPDPGGRRYGPRTLVGGWCEERSGLAEIRRAKPLASQYEYPYRTIYTDSYGRAETRRRMFKDEPHVYPGHQPELNPPHTKVTPKTTYLRDYLEPAALNRGPGHCGPRVPAGPERNPFSDAPETCSPAGAAEDPRLRGSYAPAEGPSAPCTADFHRPCTTVAAPPQSRRGRLLWRIPDGTGGKDFHS